MKRLEEEAQEYFDNNIFCDGITPFEEDISKRCFIAGANSKYVQIEKIKAHIYLLDEFDKLVNPLAIKIATLKYEYYQLLKELEDEE